MGKIADTDLDRLAAVTHYVIARVDPKDLGATKLNKIIWYADIDYYRKTGRSLSGVLTYVRMPRGPVPSGIEAALDKLKQNGLIAERSTKVIDYERREFVWLKEPDISHFAAEEIDVLNVYIDLIKPMSADKISRQTHADPLWTELDNGEPMSLGAASVVFTQPSQKDLRWAQRSTG